MAYCKPVVENGYSVKEQIVNEEPNLQCPSSMLEQCYLGLVYLKENAFL
jgi:hypothetical protein